MPVLTIILAVLGPIIVIGLCALLQLSRPARLANEEKARERLRDRFKEFEQGDCVVSKDEQSALILNSENSKLALILALGDRLVERVIGPSDLKSVISEEAEVGGRVVLALKDVTCPKVVIEFETLGAAQNWAGRVQAIG